MEGHKPHSLEYLPVFINSENSFFHYTCNAPSNKILNANNIVVKGNDFGCVNFKEVLKIPLGLYLKKGFSKFVNKDILILNLEKLLRDLR